MVIIVVERINCSRCEKYCLRWAVDKSKRNVKAMSRLTNPIQFTALGLGTAQMSGKSRVWTTVDANKAWPDLK